MLNTLIRQLEKMRDDGTELVGGTLVYMKDGETKFIIIDPARKTVNHWSKINFK